MRGAAPRTIYESSARRARRRSRRLFAAALAVLVLAAAGGTAALVLWRDGGAQAGPRPAALTPSAPASAAELRVVAPLPPAFPGRKAVARALDWAGGRAGEVGVAVVDSRGEVTGLHAHATFEGASLVKAMLLVAYLRARPAADPALDGVATTMIAESDNASAYTIYGVVGGKGLKRVATLSGMEDFEPGAGWLDSRVSAADQARFFFDLERYVPAGRRAFARRLLTGITAMQRWGIPAAAGMPQRCIAVMPVSSLRANARRPAGTYRSRSKKKRAWSAAETRLSSQPAPGSKSSMPDSVATLFRPLPPTTP